MATTPKTLDQEWLDKLVAMLAQPAYQGQGMQGPDGKWWQPLYDTSGYSGAEGGGGFQGGAPIGWLNSWDIGDKLSQQDRYDPTGKFLDTKIHKENPAWKDHLGGLAFLGGTAMGLNSVFGGGLGGLGAGGGYTGTSMAGATGGMTPAAMEAALGTAGYGMTGTIMPKLAALGLNGAGAALDFLGNPLPAFGTSGIPLTPWEVMNDFGTQFINAAEPVVETGLYNGTSMANGVSGMTPAAMEAALGTPGYGFSGAAAAASAAGLLPTLNPLLNGAGAASSFGGSFSDWLSKLGSNTANFLSSPANLLKTIGTIGALAKGEWGGDGDGGTVAQTKTLPPELQGLLSGPNGLYGQLQNWMTQNPNGQNQTMRDAQSGMRNFLLDPNLIGSFYRQGATGMGLLNTPVAKNPWGT